MGFDDTNSPSLLPPWLAESVIDVIEPRLEQVQKGNPAYQRSILDLQFTAAFEPIMEAVSGGKSLHTAIREYPIALDLGRFNSWVQRDPEREQRYKEALRLQAGVLVSEAIDIADGVNADGSPSMNDVARDRIRIETRFKAAAAHDRKTYGESKQIEVNSSINLLAIIEERDKARQAFMRTLTSDTLAPIEDATYTALAQPSGTPENDDA